MNKNIDFVKDINERYGTLEYDLDKKLRVIECEETKFKEFNDAYRSQYEANEFDACPNSLEAAKKRNLKIIEDLEKAKARLRSRIIYSPLEQILAKAQKKYLESLEIFV
ncbi:unnamed protein product [Diamesa serratosioi]